MTDQQERQPVQVSGDALRVLNEKVRQWTGWRRGSLTLGPTGRNAPAFCSHEHRQIVADPEILLLNPNRVLLTVTPFRLRQEAVLTGAILHEAGHARHSLWKPLTVEQAKISPLLHSDGTVPTEQCVALAKVMEEPRVEGLMARDADRIGATGLGWTMRAMAAHLLPPTELSMDPSQALMDLICSWALRAGRQAALNHHVKHPMASWVREFTSLVHQTIEAHLEDRVLAGAVLYKDPINPAPGVETPNYRSLQILSILNQMIQCEDDTGPTMIDSAREVLRMLFPETDDESDEGDEEAMPNSGCGAGSPESTSEAGAPEDNAGKGDESGADGEGNTEPEDEGSGAEPGAGDSDEGTGDDESDEEDSGEAEGQPEADEPGDDGSDPQEDKSEEPGATDSTSPMARALARMEEASKSQVEDEAEDEAEQTPPMEQGASGGAGPGGALGGSWRTPTSEERDVQKGAEKFLRNMIDSSEVSTRSITDQPSASVDGAALSAWKAGGQYREPNFFIRTRRQEQPSPPIEIAVLVDVSSSMDVLQAPSALLSWAMAGAALDLRNFAGRGQQVKSCLIHWGDSVKVIQRPGEVLPGIRVTPCRQGTSNMHGALDMIEEIMPGFYDPARDVNRLIVQFTDWKVFQAPEPAKRVGRALAAGVNMLSVVPHNYSARYARLDEILRMCPIQRGHTTLVKYNEGNPAQVWQRAAETLEISGQGSTPTSRIPVYDDEATAYGF